MTAQGEATGRGVLPVESGIKLLLASKSPRRRQLLSMLGLPIEVVAVDVDESTPMGVAVEEKAELLARRKAMAYPASRLQATEVLVAADTVVVCDNVALGKPASRAEAVAMLQALSGRGHEVYTGVCLRSSNDEVAFSEVTKVFFRRVEMAEIEYYVDTYKPFDKAGAYGIQEWIGMVAVERIEGCYYNVMGLPVARLYEMLRKRFLSR